MRVFVVLLLLCFLGNALNKSVAASTNTHETLQTKKNIVPQKPIKKNKKQSSKKNIKTKSNKKIHLIAPTNATIMKTILRKLSSYQTIKYTMEIRKDNFTTIQQTYYRNPDKIRHEYYQKSAETKKQIRIYSGNILRENNGNLFTEGPGGPFKLFRINLDKQPSWKTNFESFAIVKGRKTWQVKFTKEDRSYIRAWFDINTGVIMRREDFPPQGKKPGLVGITKDLRVNEVLSPSLFEQ